MSVFDLIDPSKTDQGLQGIQTPSATFTDVFSASVSGTARNFLFNSKEFFTGKEVIDRDKKYRELTGRDIYDDAIQNSPNREELLIARQMKNPTDSQKLREAADKWLTTLREQDPNKYASVLNSSEIADKVKTDAVESLKKQSRASAGATPTAAMAGQIGGAVAASFIDPLNLATIPLGAGMGAGILRTAIIEGAINAGVEAATFPFVERWQKELGQEYGIKDLTQNMGIGFLFGAGVGAGAKALSMGLDRVSNSARLIELETRVRDINPELADAAHIESRRLHIDESNPARHAPDVEPGRHQVALREVDSALNEGRALDPRRLEVNDSDIRRMSPEKMDESLKKIHARMNEIESAAPAPRAVNQPVNELIDLNPPVMRTLDEQDELSKYIQSPEYRQFERAQFEEAASESAPDTRIFGEDDGGDVSLESLREAFRQEKEYLDAINTCSIGGGGE